MQDNQCHEHANPNWRNVSQYVCVYGVKRRMKMIIKSTQPNKQKQMKQVTYISWCSFLIKGWRSKKLPVEWEVTVQGFKTCFSDLPEDSDIWFLDFDEEDWCSEGLLAAWFFDALEPMKGFRIDSWSEESGWSEARWFEPLRFLE